MFPISISNSMENRPGVIYFFRYSVLILVMACPVLCHSQHLKFDHIDAQDGLSQNNVTCIIQEDRGFIWVGTDDGLNRYDGYQFITYGHNPKDNHSLSNNFIGDII